MEPSLLSARYAVRRLGSADLPALYRLCAGNPLYYRYCPPPVTRRSLRQDMRSLPPGKSEADKYYLGFFDGAALVAVMDLILAYPNPQTAFVGFFMMDAARQGRGEGSALIEEAAGALGRAGFAALRLGYVKGNPQSEAFWRKNRFLPTGAESRSPAYTIVLMERPLTGPGR